MLGSTDRLWKGLIAVTVGFFLFSSNGHAAEKLKLTMAATSANYSPYFVAIEKGYFAKEGFDVEIVKAGGGTATPALMSGSIDASTSGSSAESAILKGAPLEIVFVPWDRPTYQIWSTRPDIKTVEDMKGKQVGIQTRGDTFEIAVRIVLKNRGMDPNSVGYTPLGYGGGRMAAIKSGSLPVVVLSQIDVSRPALAGALKKGHLLVDTFNEVKMPYTGIAVSDKAIASDRARVKRLVKACLKGLAYASAFRDETIAIIMKYSKAPKEAATADYDSVVIKSRTKDGTIDEKTQQTEVELRASLVHLAADRIPPLKNVFDFSMAREANNELKAEGWKPTR